MPLDVDHGRDAVIALFTLVPLNALIAFISFGTMLQGDFASVAHGKLVATLIGQLFVRYHAYLFVHGVYQRPDGGNFAIGVIF